jgi:hypothetical protein
MAAAQERAARSSRCSTTRHPAADFRGNRQCISVGKCRRRRPCRPHPDGLPEPLASQDLRQAELRDLAEFYYSTRKLQAHFFAGDLASAVHASRRAVPLLWTSNSFFSSDDRRGHTSRNLSIVLTLGITAGCLAPSSPLSAITQAASGGFPDRPSSGRGRASLDSRLGCPIFQTLLSEDCVVLSSVDVNLYVVVLMKSRLQVKKSNVWVRAAVLETDSYLQRPDVQLEDRCSLNGSP